MRVPFAEWTPATHDPEYPIKYGYFGVPTRPLDVIEFVVAHDAVGFRDALSEGHRPGERASWTFSNLTDGRLLQHYELEAPTWTSGTIAANIAGVAIENESIVGDFGAPINDLQVANIARLYEWLQPRCPRLEPPRLGEGFEEHRLLTGGLTSCPNDRIRWDDIAARIHATEEPEEDDMKRYDLINDGSGKYWLLTIEGRAVPLSGGHLNGLKKLEAEGVVTLTNTRLTRAEAEAMEPK